MLTVTTSWNVDVTALQGPQSLLQSSLYADVDGKGRSAPIQALWSEDEGVSLHPVDDKMEIFMLAFKQPMNYHAQVVKY